MEDSGPNSQKSVQGKVPPSGLPADQPPTSPSSKEVRLALPRSALYLLELLDAAVVAHLLQLCLEGLDAGRPIRETAHWGKALRGEVQRVRVLVDIAGDTQRQGRGRLGGAAGPQGHFPKVQLPPSPNRTGATWTAANPPRLLSPWPEQPLPLLWTPKPCLGGGALASGPSRPPPEPPRTGRRGAPVPPREGKSIWHWQQLPLLSAATDPDHKGSRSSCLLSCSSWARGKGRRPIPRYKEAAGLAEEKGPSAPEETPGGPQTEASRLGPMELLCHKAQRFLEPWPRPPGPAENSWGGCKRRFPWEPPDEGS